MSNKISNSDFAEFIKQNKEKIIKTTPYNPSIKKDDEWVKESVWDDYEEDLREG